MASSGHHRVEVGEIAEDFAQLGLLDNFDGLAKHSNGPDVKSLSRFPVEILQQIATYSDWQSLLNLRITDRSIHQALEYSFVGRVGNHVRIFPRYDSLRDYIKFLKRRPVMRHLIKRITLVGEALAVHQFGYIWCWEEVASRMGEDIRFSPEDLRVMSQVDSIHYHQSQRDHYFIVTGKFRQMLTQALQMLPNLSEVIVGKLKPGEQIHGWQGEEVLKRLSFYGRKDFDTTFMMYHDYLYDEIHHIVNTYIDEYGMLVEPDDAGPQVSFLDDFDAARHAVGIKCFAIRLHGYRRCGNLPGELNLMAKYECTFDECSFCHEPYGTEQDPFFDLDAWLFRE